MPCNPPNTGAEKKWPYVEYYLGERDEENRKHGNGIHHWSGPQSLEWYTGRMLYNTMHGVGDYHWRYLGAGHLATTYEGRFYNNRMHGYGLMSYPNGSVFNGLFYKNYRCGPGVESHACLREDVGIWYGYQLIRLAWRPAVPSVAIDLVSTPVGANTVKPHRTLLTTNVKIIGKVNSALELLKQSGCDPLAAAEKWPKLYSKNCTDLSSPMCHIEAFDRAYYNNGIKTLNEVSTVEPDEDSSQSSNSDDERTTYYAWNNNNMMIHMMKHCYTHEEQRQDNRLNLKNILSGPRSTFKQAGKHELDCRTLLMASYLGNISNVATLVNESDVVPDVTDVQGNSVIMYAACGDQPDTIHFLVEVGADVDACNDACCTPLGVTLLRYVLEKHDVAYNAMLQALLPPPSAVGPPPDDKRTVHEWEINRECQDVPAPSGYGLNKVASKTNHKLPSKKASLKELPVKKKAETFSKLDVHKLSDTNINANTDAFAKDKHVYYKINTEYLIRVAEEFSVLSEVNPIPYIFEVNDMYKDVEVMKDEETKKLTDKLQKVKSKPTFKELPKKPSRDTMFQEKDDPFVDIIEQRKQEKMARIMMTILQLLSEGADPRKVRCPHPPLFIAAVSDSAELIRHLVRYGADINEVYPQAYGYSALDLAVSGPLTAKNLEVIQTLLESGANPDHRLKVPPPLTTPTEPDMTPDSIMVEGPTLLHAVLARKIDAEVENTAEIRHQLLELLLQYGCNPITHYNGHSAVDIAMNKSMELFDIFLKSPQTNLNAIINDSNQTILVKMFYLPFSRTIPLPERLQVLTNLLLFGADPLIKCQNYNEKYGNLFAYIKSVAIEMDSHPTNKPQSLQGGKAPKRVKSDTKQKKPLKSEEAKASKSAKVIDDIHGDYKQSLDLVVECARLLYIRWLQAKLLKELIEVVHKYKHRHWTMIIKEHTNKKCTSLWLTASRSLEIWDILKTTKKKKYNDVKILKQVLCIIQFYFKRTMILRFPTNKRIWLRPPITFQEKDFIEREVVRLTREHRTVTMSTPEIVPAIRPYVTPELWIKEEEKFNVCFECAIPLGNEKIPCDSCNLISFCSFECMKTNIDRSNCHPCNNYLKEKYYPTSEDAETNSDEIK